MNVIKGGKTMADITVESKEKALNSLRNQPDNFRWAIKDTILERDGLIREVETSSEIGVTIIGLMLGISSMPGIDLPDKNDSSKNMLGKRYRCLLCGTEVLSTKAGAGRVSCHEQLMASVEPRQLPSSD